MVGEKAAQFSRRNLLVHGAGTAILAACSAEPARSAQSAPLGRNSNARRDLYNCEGCEGAFERPASGLSSSARIASPGELGEPMRLTGVVFRPDSRTPAPGVIVYAYQTDAGGRYSRGTPESEWSRRHGLLRGWVRTGADGRYAYDTVKPAPYPGEQFPAHVHLTVLEPGRRPYWIDNVVFAGEFGVSDTYRRERENRGGDGIVTLKRESGVWVARRNIILEVHPG